MKENILLLCSDYASPSHANSICVQNLAEEFVREGHKVWVMSWAESMEEREFTHNGVNIVERKRNLFSRVICFFGDKEGPIWSFLFKMIQLFRFAYTFLFYPNVAPMDSWRLGRSAARLITEKGITTVVATYRPYETIKAAIELKKRFGEKIWVSTYHLDLLTSPDNTSVFILKAKNKQHDKALHKELKMVDRILLPNSAPICDNCKVRYVDFPVFVCNKIEFLPAISFDNTKINISYVGSLDIVNRNPEKFFSILSDIPLVEGREVILHIWGKLSDNEVKKMVDSSPKVIYHGMARSEEVPGLLSASDFLLNVGNGITYKMIPSKVFQYFASAKPIINLVRHKDDASLPYFKKYGYSLPLYLIDDVNEADLVAAIIAFINRYYRIKLSISPSLFEESSPSFICKQIVR